MSGAAVDFLEPRLPPCGARDWLAEAADDRDGGRRRASERTPRQRLLVIVLHYSGVQDTIECLRSLAGRTCKEAAVLVIDNGSRDGLPAEARSAFPDVEFVRVATNLGWAGGNNLGLRVALDRGYEAVCLLNNDTVVGPEALDHLLEAADALDTPALLHPAIHYFDEPARPQLFPPAEPATADAQAEWLAATHDVVELDHVYGACLLFRTDIVRQVGFIDERFFLQLEEHDYFLRARRFDMRSYCARRARILHKESASFGGRVTPDKCYYQVRNRFLIAEKHEAGLLGRLLAAREVYWSLCRKASVDQQRAISAIGFVRWFFSGTKLACAARAGARDYVLRRFGPRMA